MQNKKWNIEVNMGDVGATLRSEAVTGRCYN